MNPHPPAALLISGVDTVGSGRLPHLLSDAGFTVHLLGSDHLSACRSKFVSERIPSAPGPHAAANSAREHLAVYRASYASIVLADEPTLWAALDDGEAGERSKDWLRDWFPVPLSCASLDQLRSKTTFLMDSRQAGIATPAFEVCANEAELWRAVESIGFPVFIKAVRGWAGSGLTFARSKSDLEAQIQRVSFEGPVLVQEEVSGEAGSLSVLYRAGVPVCWFAYLMIRTWPNRFSSACAIKMFPHPDAATLVESTGRLTGFTGLAGIDFVWNRETDRLKLLEFNPRPTPVYHLGPLAGVDFGKALRDLREDTQARQTPNKCEDVIDLYPQALYDAIDRRRPLTFFRSFGDAPWSDPGLAAAYFRRFLTHYIPGSIRQWLRAATAGR
jgi:predicted ATP-grasp superfamily ATP-dependent carboligase